LSKSNGSSEHGPVHIVVASTGTAILTTLGISEKKYQRNIKRKKMLKRVAKKK